MLAIAALLVVTRTEAWAPPPSVAFFHGEPAPVAEKSHFDLIVVEPMHLDAGRPAALQRAGVQVFAYLSVGRRHGVGA